MNKEEFQQHASNLIDDISNRIDELRQRAATVADDLKPEFEKRLTRLMENKTELEEKLREFEETPDNLWEEVKDGFNQKMKALKDGFQKLYSSLTN